jgi:hypothetical protein
MIVITMFIVAIPLTFVVATTTIIVSMATPLNLYMGAVKFLQAIGKVQPGKLANAATTQAERVIQELGNLSFDRGHATELLELLATDDPDCAFTTEQRTNIADVLITVLEGVDDVATPITRVVNKEQRHGSVFDYLPDIMWSVLRSKDTMRNKYTHLVQFCVETLQLRNADAQTRRLLVATTHEASGEDKDPGACYEDFTMISDIFKQKRIDIKGEQSLKTFPVDPAEYIKRYPTSYPDDALPVKCPLSTRKILARTNKTSIPCRSNNAKIAGNAKQRQSSTISGQSSAPIEDTAMNTMKMMATCMQFLKGETKGSASSDVLTGLTIFGKDSGQSASHGQSPTSALTAEEDDGAASAMKPLVGRKDILPGCIAASAGQTHGNLKALRDKVIADLAIAPSTSSIPEKKKEKVDEEKADEEKEKADGKKEKAVIKRPASAKAPLKRPAAVLDDNASVAEVFAAKKNITNFPFAISMLRKAKALKNRPTIPKNRKLTNAHYMSGHIYTKYGGAPILRVFTRKGDRHEHRLPYEPKDNANVQQQWNLACAIIEADPRVVPE